MFNYKKIIITSTLVMLMIAFCIKKINYQNEKTENNSIDLSELANARTNFRQTKYKRTDVCYDVDIFTLAAAKKKVKCKNKSGAIYNDDYTLSATGIVILLVLCTIKSFHDAIKDGKRLQEMEKCLNHELRRRSLAEYANQKHHRRESIKPVLSFASKPNTNNTKKDWYVFKRVNSGDVVGTSYIQRRYSIMDEQHIDYHNYIISLCSSFALSLGGSPNERQILVNGKQKRIRSLRRF